jgi:hypothetical protein
VTIEQLHPGTPSHPAVLQQHLGTRAPATLAVFVAHAAPGSKTEHFCHDVLSWGKPLLTLESDENANLLALGVRLVQPENISAQWVTK